jgi:histidine triad (HIT) family protein
MTYDNDNIFAKILRGEIPCDKVYDDDAVLAFNDVAPQAPTHVLIIPKKPRACLADCVDDDAATLARMQLAAVKIAKDKGLDAYRLVTNCGADAGQTVFHLHLHLIGGKKLSSKLG